MKTRRILYVVAICLVAAAAAGVMYLHRPGQSCAPTASAAAAHPAGLVRFTDTKQNTSLLVQTDAHAKDAGDFYYVTPDGSVYQGGPASGLQASSPDPLACSGLIKLEYTGPAQVLAPTGSSGDATTSKANVHLVALLDLARLGASITFQDLTNNHNFVTTVHPPTNMPKVVQDYGHAASQQDWATLYSMTAKSVVAGYSEDQFAQAMQKQVQTVGTISAIQMTSTPQVAANPAGITYFTVNEQVTMTHNGTDHTFSVVAVYVLEDGVWKFWFSKPL